MKKQLKMIAAGLLSAAMLATGASALNLGVGTVTASSLNLRSSASTGSTILDCVDSGTQVVVLSQDDGWYEVYCEGERGYMLDDYVAVSEAADFRVGKGVVLGDEVSIRTGPGTDYFVTAFCYDGNELSVIGVSGEWYKVETYNGIVGYMRSDFVDVTAPLSDEAYSATTTSVTTVSTVGQQIIDYAKQFLGVPYVYGGTSGSGFDCSGLVYYCYNHFDYSITRRASTIWYDGAQVSKDQLRIGDCVFFSSDSSSSIEHVGMYIGDGQFIHASSGGGCVKINNLSDAYYLRNYYGAVRIA